MTEPLPALVLVSLSATGLAFAFCGARIALGTGLRVTGGLLALAGLSTLAAVALSVTSGPPMAALIVAGQLVGMTVMAYPRPSRDWASLVSVAGLITVPVLLWAAGYTNATLFGLALTAIPLLQAWWRLEVASPQERIQLLWVVGSFAPVALLGGVIAFVEPPVAVVAAWVASISLVGWSAWRGLSRTGDVDVRGIVSKAAVNVTALVGVLVGYRTAKLIVETAGAEELSLVLLVVALLAVEPMRRLLRLISDEFLFGVRPDPVRAASRVAREIGHDRHAALATLRAALVLPYAELTLSGLPATISGEPSGKLHAIPLVLDGRPAGEIRVALRPGDLRLPDADRTVLELAGPLLAQTVRAQALADRLQEARVQATTSREEERRRLRRDLHDGLGPRLSGIALTADAARLARDDPDALDTHLERVRAESVAAIREIRELVYGLRPPALDEVGLVAAIRLQAETMRTPAGEPMKIALDAEGLPSLHAAVEVAAYRIVTEALHNSARHSGSRSAEARLVVIDDSLSIRVRDGGTSTDWRLGVGLSSMRERVEELGGNIDVGKGEVNASLPLLVTQ